MYTIGQLETRVRRILFEQQEDRFTQADILRWLNDGIEELWKILRVAKEDYFVKVMKSTDSASFLMDRTYDPSSLQFASDTVKYVLPPDFMSMKYIRPIGTNINFSKFYASDISSNIFDALAVSSIGGNTDFLYDIIENNLIVAPSPGSEMDIEIAYSYRISPLRILEGQTDGTCSIPADGTLVTGVSSKFLYATVGQRFIPGTIDPSRIYPTITEDTTITNTAMTLSGPVSKIAVSSASYTIEDAIPLVMSDYSRLIIDFAVSTAMASDKSPKGFSEAFDMFQRGEKKTNESASDRTQGSSNMVEPYL